VFTSIAFLLFDKLDNIDIPFSVNANGMAGLNFTPSGRLSQVGITQSLFVNKSNYEQFLFQAFEIKSFASISACFNIARRVPSGISPVWLGIVVSFLVTGFHQISWLPAACR